MNVPARQELGAFLRARRARLTPEDVGLAPGRRRRSPGLRREEVAVLAGVSTTWYTYLEQARDVQPSPEVLDALARALQLTTAERRHLHGLALGVIPIEVGAAGDETAAERAARSIIEVCASSPHPVYAANWRAEVLCHNDAAAQWYTDFAARPATERNMLRWMLFDPAARTRIVDWEKEARDLTGRFRAMALGRTDNRHVHLVQELLSSPDYAKWWNEHEVHDQMPRPRTLDHPEHGVRTFELTVVYPGAQRDVIIVFHTPVAEPAQP